MTLRMRLSVAFFVLLLGPLALVSVWLVVALVPRPALVGRSGATLAAATAFAIVLVAALLAMWLGRLATRPLMVLLATVRRANAGDLTARCGLSGRDETGRLGSALDRLIAHVQETQRISVTDPLTGLGNLRDLTESLRVEIERATRFGRSLGVLVIDLDHFKSVNDLYGHRAGDAVLVEFAWRVRRAIREVDAAFRQGGEEFVILLPETDVAGSLTAARRIGEAVRQEVFPLEPPPGIGEAMGPAVPDWIRVTVSIGVAVFPRHGRTGVAVLDAADRALYAAKQAGRDACAVATTGGVTARPATPQPCLAPRAAGSPAVVPAAGGAEDGSVPTSSARSHPAD